jgi:agmatine deiminase
MPAEWTEHERTIMCWPARADLWRDLRGAAEASYAEVANAIAAFEPVLMAAHPRDAERARRACSGAVEVVEIPIDDSWARDTGPILVTGRGGGRAGVHWRFNGWGEKFRPYDQDAAFGARVLERLDLPRIDATDVVLEGGSIAVDGAGTLVTTEQCLLHPSRNPGLGPEAIESRLRERLGVDRVIWLGLGLVEDAHTDGHVDNVCAFYGTGRALLQTVADEADPNYEPTQENARRLHAAGIDVDELPFLPRLEWDGRPIVVPYTNFYVCNGAVIVPVGDPETDEEALDRIGELFAGREVVGLDGTTLAKGGGGIHCITQQVPASRTI